MPEIVINFVKIQIFQSIEDNIYYIPLFIYLNIVSCKSVLKY